MSQDSILLLEAEASDARRAVLSRDLMRDLNRAGVEAQPVSAAQAPNERGDVVTLGTFALALVTSGAVTALIECLKAYIARECTLKVTVKRPDGSQVEISARNVSDPALQRALDAGLPRS